MAYLSVYSGAAHSPISIIKAFFSQLNSTQDGTLNLEKVDIHKEIFEIKKKYTNEFKTFLFDDDPELPFSQQIEDVLYEMTVCNLLTRPNPTMVKYNIVGIGNSSFDELDQNFQCAVTELTEAVRHQLGGLN